MQKPIRFGILGAARIAPDALIKAAHNVPDAEVVAVAARDPQRAQEFATANGIPRVIATYDDLINDSDLDVIYNPLPNSLHCEWTIAALRAGKHVLCEKPLASNAVEAERMARAADETGRFLARRFTTAIIRSLIGARANAPTGRSVAWSTSRATFRYRFRKPTSASIGASPAEPRWTSDATRST